MARNKFFPFEIADKDELITLNNYYMKLNNTIITELLKNRRNNNPVSDIKGTFLRLHKENNGVSEREYAVFNNVFIMNKLYKLGSCSRMLVRDSEGFLSADDCDSYSDKTQNRIINTDREVFLDVKYWIFGKPTEQNLLSNKALKIIDTNLPDVNTKEINQFIGNEKNIGGKKSKIRSKKFKKSKKYKKTHFKYSKKNKNTQRRR